MNKTSKIMICLLLIFSIFASSTAIASAAECQHIHLTLVSSSVGVTIANSQYHVTMQTNVYRCNDCGAYQYTLQQIGDLGPHIYSISNGGHISGSHKHAYVYTCRVCGYSYNALVICNGPPCADLTSIGVHYD